MRGSWRIGELAGIGIYVHWSFLILPGLIGLSAFNQAGAAAALDAVLFVLAIFGCVVLHELGHALTARQFGVGTRDITLLPIGGVANLERMPRHPIQELLIAVAGPAVNVAIVIAIVLWFQVSGRIGTLLPEGLFTGSFLVRLLWANVGLTVFNLLPAFPMDGGRVLRSLLAMLLPYSQATDVAAIVGQVVAVLLGLLGLFGNFTLVLVALFVFFAGRAEAAMVRRQERGRGVNVGHVMLRQFRTLEAQMGIQDVAHSMLFDAQQEFPVIDGQRFMGMVGRGDLLAAIARGDGLHPVGEITRRGLLAVDRNAPLEPTMHRMAASGLSSAPVTDGGVMVGIVMLDMIQQFLKTGQVLHVPYAEVVTPEPVR